jgi:rubrerythrin
MKTFDLPSEFTLVLTTDHLDRSLAALASLENGHMLICQHCIVAIAARDMFGDKFQGMGFSELELFADEDYSLNNKIAYICEDARKVTECPIYRSNYTYFSNMFPLTLRFVRE